MIIGLISSYRDPLLASAVHSALTGCEQVIVAEGPSMVEEHDPPPAISLEGLRHQTRVHLLESVWSSEAQKKTLMVERARGLAGQSSRAARRKARDSLWLLWLDSDEILVHGDYLRDQALLAEEGTAGGWALRIVEPDGSVYRNNGRVVRADLIRRYLMDWTQVELHNGVTLAFSHDTLCTAGGIPALDMDEWRHLTDQEKLERLGNKRPPLAGEPHILHRWHLRPESRQQQELRGHKVERDWFEILDPHVQTCASRRGLACDCPPGYGGNE